MTETRLEMFIDHSLIFKKQLFFNKNYRNNNNERETINKEMSTELDYSNSIANYITRNLDIAEDAIAILISH